MHRTGRKGCCFCSWPSDGALPCGSAFFPLSPRVRAHTHLKTVAAESRGGWVRFSTHVSLKRSLALLSFGLFAPGAVLAGPFLASGNSTVHSVDAIYRKSTKTSSDQFTRASEVSAEQSAVSSRGTYQYSTQPTAALSSEVSETSSEVTGKSSEYTAKTSKQSTDATAPVTRATYEHSTRPTAELTTKASEASVDASEASSEVSSEVTGKSSEYTAETSKQSTDATAPVTRATYQHSTKPTAELTTKASKASVDASEASSEVTGKSSKYTAETAEQSTDATAPVTRATYEHSTKPTAELTTQGSRASSEVSAETSAYTPRVAQSTGDASTGAVRNSGDGVLTVSAALDASIENTTRLTWRKYEATLLDPDIADELIKNAHAFSGPTLIFFADELAVSSEQLASVIVRYVPKQATRTQLQRLMRYVIPHLTVDGQT